MAKSVKTVRGVGDVSVVCEPCQALPWFMYVIPPSVLACLTLLFYYPSRAYEFQFDDIANISKLYEIRTSNFWGMFFSGPRWIGRWLNALHYSIGRFDPLNYRLGNIVVHIATGICVFFFCVYALRNLKKRSIIRDNALAIATLTAALFMLHPVQTQTVSYVIQGKLEGVAALFIMAVSLCFVFAYTAQSAFAGYVLKILFFALAALATGSKEIFIVAPFIVALVDWFFVAQGSWNELKGRWLFHLCDGVVVAGLYIWFLRADFFVRALTLQWRVNNNIGNVITQRPLEAIEPLTYFMSEFKVVLHYLFIFVWPFNISVEYDWVLSRSFFAPDCFFPFLALLACGFFIGYRLRRDPIDLIAFGLIWFFVCVVPRSSIIPSSELIVDYKTYAASIGWLFVVAAALVYGVNVLASFVPNVRLLRNSTGTSMVLTAALGIVLGAATMKRNTVWRSGLEFWANMIKNAPGKARVYNNYGVELSQKLQKYKESISYYQRAIAMDQYYPDPHNNLAVVYAYLGEIDNAIIEMQEGLRLCPNYPEGYNNLAAFYLHKKDYEKAEQCLNVAIKLRPSYGKAYFNRARLYAQQDKKELALADFKNACTRADLDNEFGFTAYGQYAFQNKFFKDAILAFSKLVDIAPGSAVAHANLGNVYHAFGDYTKAVASYECALEHDPHNARATFNLGETFRKLGEHAKAIACFRRLDVRMSPMVGISMADCFIELGTPDEARKVLEAMLIMPCAKDVKHTVQTMLAELTSGEASKVSRTKVPRTTVSCATT